MGVYEQAWAEGSQIGLDASQRQRERKQGFADEYRKTRLAQATKLQEQVNQALSTKQTVDPSTGAMRALTPQELAEGQQEQAKLNDYVKQLYSPNFDPIASRIHEHPIHQLLDKLHATKPPAQQMNDLSAIQAKYSSQGDENPYRKTERVMTQAGFPKEDVTHAERIQANLEPKPSAASGKPQLKLYKMPDGSQAWLDASKPDELPDGAQPVGTTGAQPKVGSLGEYLSRTYGPNITPEQEIQGRRDWAAAVAGETEGTHVVMVPKPDGTIVPVTVATSSKKTFPGANAGTDAAAASSPKPAGQQHRDIKNIQQRHASGGVISVGKPVGGRITPAQTKAQEDYDAALKLDTMANQVENSHEPGQQRQLALALIKAMAGRVNMQEYAIYTQKYGLPNTIEGLIKGFTTGEMPDEVVNQLVGDAHLNLQSSAAALRAAMSGNNPDAGGGDTGSPKVGERKTFPNGRVGIWDGNGWEAQN